MLTLMQQLFAIVAVAVAVIVVLLVMLVMQSARVGMHAPPAWCVAAGVYYMPVVLAQRARWQRYARGVLRVCIVCIVMLHACHAAAIP